MNLRRPLIYDPRLVEQLPERRFDGVGPEAVTLGGQVQVVGHDGRGDRFVGVEECRADVEIGDGFAVVELADLLVHVVELLARRVWLVATGKHPQQQDLGIR